MVDVLVRVHWWGFWGPRNSQNPSQWLDESMFQLKRRSVENIYGTVTVCLVSCNAIFPRHATVTQLYCSCANAVTLRSCARLRLAGPATRAVQPCLTMTQATWARVSATRAASDHWNSAVAGSACVSLRDYSPKQGTLRITLHLPPNHLEKVGIFHYICPVKYLR